MTTPSSQCKILSISPSHQHNLDVNDDPRIFRCFPGAVGTSVSMDWQLKRSCTFRELCGNRRSMKKGSSIMPRLKRTPRDRRATDGEVEMSLGIARAAVAVSRVVGGRVPWPRSKTASWRRERPFCGLAQCCGELAQGTMWLASTANASRRRRPLHPSRSLPFASSPRRFVDVVGEWAGEGGGFVVFAVFD